MSEPQPAALKNPAAASRTSSHDASATRDPVFGGTLILLSTVGSVLSLAMLWFLGWHAGLATFAAIVLILLGFLWWETRRADQRALQRRSATAGLTSRRPDAL